MSVQAVHPTYTGVLSKWVKCKDCYAGEDQIKSKGTTYLPATSGQIADGQGKGESQLGEKAYQAYKTRAVFPDLLADAVEAAIGILHDKPPVFKLTPRLKELEKNATLLGEPLEVLLRRINTQQLKTGRIGLLGDFRKVKGETNKVRPVLVTYDELAIRNWDDLSKDDDDIQLQMVVLDESGYEKQPDFSWTYKEKYRVLGLINEQGTIIKEDEIGVYGYGMATEGDDLSTLVLEKPHHMGDTLQEIPFVFINSKDLSPTPDKPPLDGLANLSLTIYRGEADYRQTLFMQGQDTLVTIGATLGTDPENEGQPLRVGAGARIDLPLHGDAKYIGVQASGLTEQGQSLERDYSKAYRKGGQLIDSTSREKESGDALRIRVAAQTATLPKIAKTGAAGLERVLKIMAKWLGDNPDQVEVIPNLDFAQTPQNAQTVLQLIQAKSLGAPISEESIHTYMLDHGYTQFSYQDELKRIAKEEPLLGGFNETSGGLDDSGNQDGDS